MPNYDHMPTLRVLYALELLADEPSGLTLTELSQGSGIPKGTLLPVLNTMRANGFLECTGEGGRYRIGIKTYSIGSSYAHHLDALEFIRLQMRRVADESGETCQFGVRDRQHVLYVAIAESAKPVRLASHVGKHLPLYCTAIGKALLSGVDARELRALYPDGLRAITEKTITDFETLEQELGRIRQAGFATEHGEVSDDLACVAVPLFARNKVVGAVSVSTPIYRATEDALRAAQVLLYDLQKNVQIYLESNRISPDTFAFGGRNTLKPDHANAF